MELIERGVISLEKMVDDSHQVQFEPGPPLCPHCGHFNPRVTLPEGEGGSGLLGDYFMEVHCEECDQRFFVVIESYSCHAGIESARYELESRKAGNDGSN